MKEILFIAALVAVIVYLQRKRSTAPVAYNIYAQHPPVVLTTETWAQQPVFTGNVGGGGTEIRG